LNKDFPYKSISAIIALLILELIALIKGLNGALLSIGVGAIAGLGGFAIGKGTKPK